MARSNLYPHGALHAKPMIFGKARVEVRYQNVRGEERLPSPSNEPPIIGLENNRRCREADGTVRRRSLPLRFSSRASRAASVARSRSYASVTSTSSRRSTIASPSIPATVEIPGSSSRAITTARQPRPVPAVRSLGARKRHPVEITELLPAHLSRRHPTGPCRLAQTNHDQAPLELVAVARLEHPQSRIRRIPPRTGSVV